MKGNAYKTSYMLKRNDITRKVSFESFSVLGTKTLKRMESSLYGNRKEHYQKRVFLVSSATCVSKYLKKKKTCKTPCMEKQRNRTLPKTGILSVFYLVIYKKRQNAYKELYKGKG